MSKVILALLIIACSFNITFAQQVKLNADLLKWSWDKCKVLTQVYSQYRDTNSTIALIDDEVFNCAQFDIEQQKQCEKNKNIQNLSTQSKNFYQSCFENFALRNSTESLIIRGICSSSRSKCESCKRDSNCKTFEKGNSDLQNQYIQYRNNTNNTLANCAQNRCSNQLKPFAQVSCLTYEAQSCVLEWQTNNMRNDTCVEYSNCAFYKQSSSVLLKLSALILVAFFAF